MGMRIRMTGGNGHRCSGRRLAVDDGDGDAGLAGPPRLPCRPLSSAVPEVGLGTHCLWRLFFSASAPSPLSLVTEPDGPGLTENGRKKRIT